MHLPRQPAQQARRVGVRHRVGPCRPGESPLRAEDPLCEQLGVPLLLPRLDALGQVQELSARDLLVKDGGVPRKPLEPCTDPEKGQAHGAENDQDHTGQPIDDGEDLEHESSQAAEIPRGSLARRAAQLLGTLQL